MDIVLRNEDGSVRIKFYGEEVANSTPGMLRILSLIWFVTSTIATILVFRRPKEDSSKEEELALINDSTVELQDSLLEDRDDQGG